MEQGGGDCRFVQSEVCGDVGDRDGVGHVGLAGAPQLALVSVDRDKSRSPDHLDFAVGVVLEETSDQSLDRARQHGIG